MNIALYFGSFNPIHNGHIGLAKYILRIKDIDELWFVVTPQNPLKHNDSLLLDVIRIEMSSIAIQNECRIKVCKEEMSLPKPNYTINTLTHLSSKYPQHRFTLVIGADNMDIFDKWKDYDLILDKYKILVYPRDNSNIFSNKFPQMEVLNNAPLFNISSTDIRLKIQQGERVDHLLPKAVYEFIVKNKLYI